MATKLQRKRRLARRHAHTNTTKPWRGPSVPWLALDEVATFVEQLPVGDLTPVEQHPARAKCSVCGFSQKVRKDGTMGRHDVFLGTEAQPCEGTRGPYLRA